jgi:ATP-dependent DNA helicase RecQ
VRSQLKAWRLEVARERAVPAYVVLHDSTLETIAGIRPTTEGELAVVPGIGPAKLEAYGDAIIEICGVSEGAEQSPGELRATPEAESTQR